MNTEDAIVAIVGAVNHRQIEGRKRLQKFVHLLKRGGIDIPARFKIHHYGPFSEDVATAADSLVFEGVLEEKVEPKGAYRTFQYVYSLPKSCPKSEAPVGRFKKLIQELDQFTTIELEVASTIAFFEETGRTHQEAIEQTKFLKPNKAVSSVTAKAEDILCLVSTYGDKKS